MSSSVRPGSAKVVRSYPSASQSPFKPTTAITQSASFARSTAWFSNSSKSWTSAPPRRSAGILKYFLLINDQQNFDPHERTYPSQFDLRLHQLDHEHCRTRREFHVWCLLSSEMYPSPLVNLDRRKHSRVVDGSNCRSRTDYPRRAISKVLSASLSLHISCYLCSPGGYQSKLKSAVIRSRFQVTSHFQRPFICHPLRYRCSDEDPWFIN